MKILICDDDPATVDVIKSQIHWDNLGIHHVLTAYNGLAAKQVIADEKPDIIICDIGMPLCNGIEVLKFVKELGLQSEFMFLTCYESFEFAKEAVRYGASRYLTKPLDLAELLEELNQMANVAKTRHITPSAETRYANSQKTVLISLLRSLCDGLYGTDQQKLAAAIKKKHISVKADDIFRYVMISGDTANALDSGWTRDSLCYSFSYLAQEIIADCLNFKNVVIKNGDSNIRIIIFLNADQFSEADALARCQRFCTISNAYTGIAPVCVIGESAPLYMTYSAILKIQAKLNKVRLQTGKTFLQNDQLQYAESGSLELDETQLLNYMKQQDKAGYLRCISGYVNKITSGRSDSDVQMTLLHHALLQAFYQCIRDNRIAPHLIFRNDEVREADGKSEQSSYHMIRFAGILFDRVQQLLAENTDSNNTIDIAKKYIHEHFRENIDRDMIASIACITPNYLSKRFRAETGLSLREYVNQLRINEAKRLLLSTNKSISEIAGEVGFDNISYFSTVFRKFCNISPLEWKHGSSQNNL